MCIKQIGDSKRMPEPSCVAIKPHTTWSSLSGESSETLTLVNSTATSAALFVHLFAANLCHASHNAQQRQIQGMGRLLGEALNGFIDPLQRVCERLQRVAQRREFVSRRRTRQTPTEIGKEFQLH